MLDSAVPNMTKRKTSSSIKRTSVIVRYHPACATYKRLAPIATTQTISVDSMVEM